MSELGNSSVGLKVASTVIISSLLARGKIKLLLIQRFKDSKHNDDFQNIQTLVSSASNSLSTYRG